MGFWSTLKEIFSLSGKGDAELEGLRKKHGIDAKSKEDILHEIKNEPNSPDYDVWEELRNIRAYFWFGSWITRKIKYRPIGEEKVKKQLEELAKKREDEEKRKREQGE
jgi:hypothetical protein